MGVKFSVCPSILLNSIECSPLGVNKGVNIPPGGQISPLGARGEVKNGPLTNPDWENVSPSFIFFTGTAGFPERIGTKDSQKLFIYKTCIYIACDYLYKCA
jgi:hypothetical protein